MTAPHSTTSPDKPRKIDISLTQVAAAALAAVTAALLASRLGAAGTLIGAAMASVILNVGTAVYRASLEHSQQKIRILARRGRPLPTAPEGSTPEQSHPPATDVPLGDEQLTADQGEQPADPDQAPQPGNRARWLTGLRWGTVVVGALGGFMLAMMFITGVEWASGETVGGHGEGTTLGRVIDAPAGPQTPVVPPAPSSSSVPPSETPTGTMSPSAPTTTPDAGSDVEPSPSTTPGSPVPSEVVPPPLIPPGLPGGR